MTNPMTEVTKSEADERLTSFIERIEFIQAQKDAAAEDLKEVYSEAKAAGYDSTAMRNVIKWRNTENPTRDEAEAMALFYRDVVGEK